MLIGTLDALVRYPVKGLRAQALEAADIASGGIAGDRSSALFVRAGSPRAGKIYSGKQHETLHLLRGAQAAIASALQRGIGVEVRGDEHFFDDAPISLLVDRWLDELAAQIGYRVEWERFRPNLFVRAEPEFALTEAELVGAQLQLGSVKLRVRSPIVRCVTVTYHPQGGRSDPRVLSLLAQRRGACMGIYCDVLEPGAVRVGDLLRANLSDLV